MSFLPCRNLLQGTKRNPQDFPSRFPQGNLQGEGDLQGAHRLRAGRTQGARRLRAGLTQGGHRNSAGCAQGTLQGFHGTLHGQVCCGPAVSPLGRQMPTKTYSAGSRGRRLEQRPTRILLSCVPNVLSCGLLGPALMGSPRSPLFRRPQAGVLGAKPRPTLRRHNNGPLSHCKLYGVVGCGVKPRS